MKYLIGFAAAFVLILMLQNMDSVSLRFLFWQVSLPRIVLLFTAAALGFGAGFLSAKRY